MSHPILGPDTISWQGVHYLTLLSSAESKGALSITDSVSPPKSGPPRHIHHDADETFVLLSGDCTFWMAGETFDCGPGRTVFVPKGVEHTFQVSSDLPSRHLIILTPGGFEGFFAEMARHDYRIPEDMAAIEACAKAYDLTFTGPPLDA